MSEPLSRFDLRLRSLDLEPGEPICLCSGCGGVASWSVWLHTPEWGRGEAGDTRVLCNPCSLDLVGTTANLAMVVTNV